MQVGIFELVRVDKWGWGWGAEVIQYDFIPIVAMLRAE